MKARKVSVIMPVYNGEKYLKEAIESILSQDFIDFEFIIINDGSTDNSPQILNEIKDSNKNVKVIHQENQGSSGARNTAIDLAEGKYIQFLDADDLWKPTFLESIFQLIQNFHN